MTPESEVEAFLAQIDRAKRDGVPYKAWIEGTQEEFEVFVKGLNEEAVKRVRTYWKFISGQDDQVFPE
jgi:hypothetical protein